MAQLVELLKTRGRGFDSRAGQPNNYSLHYLLVNIPIYLVWEFWVQLNSIQFLFADHIIFNNGYVKRAHTMQRITKNNNNNKKKV